MKQKLCLFVNLHRAQSLYGNAALEIQLGLSSLKMTACSGITGHISGFPSFRVLCPAEGSVGQLLNARRTKGYDRRVCFLLVIIKKRQCIVFYFSVVV